MSESFDIEKFSRTAEKLTETLEKSSAYIHDVDQAMEKLHAGMQGTDIDGMLRDYEARLQQLNQSCERVLSSLAGQPREMQEAAGRLAEITERFGDSYDSLEKFREHGQKLIQLLEGMGSLSDFERRLKAYEDELGRATEALDKIRDRELAIQNLPGVIDRMQGSVSALQQKYLDAADELHVQGKAAEKGVAEIDNSIRRAETLQKDLTEQVKFFRIGLYALIVMNALMLALMAAFLGIQIFRA